MESAALLIQNKWFWFVHNKFIESACLLREENIAQQRNKFMKTHDFRSYVFSQNTTQKLELFSKYFSKILLLIKNKRKSRPDIRQNDNPREIIDIENRKIFSVFGDQIPSAYIHSLYRNESLMSLQHEETQLSIELELLDAADTFILEWDSFIYHITIKARQNTKMFFYEGEEHLLNSTKSLICTLMESFRVFLGKHATWKEEIKEIRLFALENSIYTIQKVKSLKQMSSSNLKIIYLKDDFFNAKFKEHIAHLPFKGKILKDVQEQILKIRKDIELFPEVTIPRRLRNFYADIRDVQLNNVDVMMHEILLENVYEVSYIPVLEDINLSHIFDDLYAELCCAMTFSKRSKPYSLVFLCRFLHQLYCDTTKIEDFYSREVMATNLSKPKLTFQPIKIFCLIRDLIVMNTPFETFWHEFSSFWINLHEFLACIGLRLIFFGLGPDYPTAFRKASAKFVSKFQNPHPYQQDITITFSFIIDCFVFLFDEISMLKTLCTNEKIKRNFISAHMFGYIEELNNFKKRHDSTNRLEQWISKTCKEVLSPDMMVVFHKKIKHLETRDTMLKTATKWLLWNVICSLPISQMFSMPDSSAFTLEAIENIIPGNVFNTHKYARLTYPETLDLDTERINKLRIINHNAAVYLGFFHTILPFARANLVDIIMIENLMFETEALTIQAFASFLKQKTRFNMAEQLQLTQCFMLCRDEQNAIYLRMKDSISRFWFNALSTAYFKIPELDYMLTFATACIVKYLKPNMHILEQIIKLQVNVYKNLHFKYIMDVVTPPELQD